MTLQNLQHWTPFIKLVTLVTIVALHVFHPGGQAAAMPLSLLVAGGAWLVEACLVSKESWSNFSLALIGPSTMPFYIGVLLLNAAVSQHLPTPLANKEEPVFVSTPSGGMAVAGPPQGGCGSSCGSKSGGGGCGSGGCGTSGGGCGSGCGASAKNKKNIASTSRSGSSRTQSADIRSLMNGINDQSNPSVPVPPIVRLPKDLPTPVVKSVQSSPLSSIAQPSPSTRSSVNNPTQRGGPESSSSAQSSAAPQSRAPTTAPTAIR